MAQEYPELTKAGFAVHAITAEPADEEKIRGLLEARGCPDLPFHIHSDPLHKLCAEPFDEHYVTKLFEGTQGDYDGVKYNMVQPAMEVVDKTGEVVLKWSWRSFKPPLPDFEDPVQNVTHEGETLKLVLARPVTSDILPAIKEGRDVKLAHSITFPPSK